MLKLALALATSLSVLACAPTPENEAREAESAPTESELSLTTNDGVVLYGDVYRVANWQAAPVILLFHQGGANGQAEYASIRPLLHAQGKSTVIIDQRQGGDRLGGTNRTVDGLGDVEYSYCDAYPDLEATLKYVKDQGFEGKKIVWGSSYSATLVVQLASRNSDDVDGVLAFSPSSGGPLADCKPDPYLVDLSVPLLALRPASEMENEAVAAQLEMFKSYGHQTYVSANGVHGSSMLNPDRIEGSPNETWDTVNRFIASVVGVD